MTGIGTVIDGKYEILKEIGRGGMSVVYLAMDIRLNKQWAVKEIKKKGSGKNDEIIVNSLLAEANLMKRLDHPSLPRIVDIIDNGVTIYVVMDYIEGESLDKILNEYGAQSEELVIGWAKQLCDALGYLHSQKPPIIYRDMKPGNIMLKPEGNIKIIDFGIAREYKEQNLADTTVLGTKGYAPPEQYSGQTDPRSDIYALGMTMHHLLTGVDPRNGEIYAPVRQWNPALSEGIEIIINKCTEPAPGNRYQSCSELLYDLEHPDLITKGYKKKQKKRMRAFVAALIVFVIALAGGFVCSALSAKITNNNYENLVNQVDSLSSYKEAVELDPSKTEAYLKIIDYYEDYGFDHSESSYIQGVYNANVSSLDDNEDNFAELNYRMGILYFTLYTEENGSASFSARIQKASSYFEANTVMTADYDEKTLSDCYYQICSFYKEYVLKTNGDEAQKEDYEELLLIIEETLDAISEESEYDRLALCSAAAALIYDQNNRMADVGVDEQILLNTMEDIYFTANSLTVQKEQSVELKNEIINNYDIYVADIERAYENSSKGTSDEEGES